jgi:nucleotide-binding universal stress UspA family protein
VQALAEKFGSTVTLLRATLSPEELVQPTAMALPIGDAAAFGNLMGPGGMEDFDAIMAAEKSETESYLSAVAERFKGHGFEVKTEHMEGSPADVIIKRAAGIQAGLLAMTTHDRSGLARALVGSVADQVVRKSACPVLLVRVSEKELKAG